MASILVFNTSFQNRGDALMLRALQERLGSAHDWSISANIAFKSPGDCRAMKICLSSDLPGETIKQRVFNRCVGLAAWLAKSVPAAWRHKTRFRVLGDIQLAFDLSGYQFGDFWGEAKIERATRNYKKLQDAGAKVILMPRTWGPFDTIADKSLEGLFEQIDLAFARDMVSFAAINAKIRKGQQGKLHFAPDYTHAVEPGRTGTSEIVSWIVPSQNVVASKSLGAEEYSRLLGVARNLLSDAGLNPKLLIHEVSNDRSFARDSQKMGFAPKDVVVAESALHAKTLIAGAAAVVTSRLHATYNALNNSVPVAVIPWNFKYAQALDHYNCPECLIDLSRPEASLIEKIKLITDTAAVADLKSRMAAGKAEQVRQTETMWRRVSEVADLDAD